MKTISAYYSLAAQVKGPRMYSYREPETPYVRLFNSKRRIQKTFNISAFIDHLPFGKTKNGYCMELTATQEHDATQINTKATSQHYKFELERFLDEDKTRTISVYLGSLPHSPRLRETKRDFFTYMSTILTALKPVIQVAEQYKPRVQLILDQINSRPFGMKTGDTKPAIEQNSELHHLLEMLHNRIPIAIEPHAFNNERSQHLYKFRQCCSVQVWQGAKKLRTSAKDKYTNGVILLWNNPRKDALSLQDTYDMFQRESSIVELGVNVSFLKQFKLINK